MPHVTGHFCVCHVELWLLFHDFFPCTQCAVYLGTWSPGRLGTYLGKRDQVPGQTSDQRTVYDMLKHVM